MDRLGDSPELKNLLNSLTEFIQDPNRDRVEMPKDQDWSNFNPDSYHLHDLIKAGMNRCIAVNEPPCHCVEGYEFVREGNGPNAIPCRNCGKLKKSLNLLQRSQLPNDALTAALSEYEFDSLLQENAFNEMISWDRVTQPPSFLMHGRPGNGKSSLLYIIAKHKTSQGFRVKYAHHYRTFEAEKDSWSDNASKPHLNQFLNDVEVLLLDEFGGLGGGVNKYSDWFKNTTIELIGSIYERWKSGRMSVIFTTNVYPALLRDKLFEGNYAALSRMQEMFQQPIEMTGRDRRSPLNRTSVWGQ